VKRRGAHRVLVWRPDGKRVFERRRRRWKDIKNGVLRSGTGTHGLAIYHSADFHIIALKNIVNIST
jgi:hypothetical protein